MNITSTMVTLHIGLLFRSKVRWDFRKKTYLSLISSISNHLTSIPTSMHILNINNILSINQDQRQDTWRSVGYLNYGPSWVRSELFFSWTIIYLSCYFGFKSDATILISILYQTLICKRVVRNIVIMMFSSTKVLMCLQRYQCFLRLWRLPLDNVFIRQGLMCL